MCPEHAEGSLLPVAAERRQQQKMNSLQSLPFDVHRVEWCLHILCQ